MAIAVAVTPVLRENGISSVGSQVAKVLTILPEKLPLRLTA